MIEKVQTPLGMFEAHTMVVNVRWPQFPGGAVRLKPSETTSEAWAWDDKLTLEFTNSRPAVPPLMLRSTRCRPCKLPATPRPLARPWSVPPREPFDTPEREKEYPEHPCLASFPRPASSLVTPRAFS